MKMNRLRWFLVFLLVGVVFQLPAQQGEADRKLLADIRTKAEQGDAQSQDELGIALAEGNLGVAKDEAEAVKWFRKAAEQNNPWSEQHLGTFYYSGRGVAKNEVEAVKWLRKAAEHNLALAQCKLGIAYDRG